MVEHHPSQNPGASFPPPPPQPGSQLGYPATTGTPPQPNQQSAMVGTQAQQMPQPTYPAHSGYPTPFTPSQFGAAPPQAVTPGGMPPVSPNQNGFQSAPPNQWNRNGHIAQAVPNPPSASLPSTPQVTPKGQEADNFSAKDYLNNRPLSPTVPPQSGGGFSNLSTDGQQTPQNSAQNSSVPFGNHTSEPPSVQPGFPASSQAPVGVGTVPASENIVPLGQGKNLELIEDSDGNLVDFEQLSEEEKKEYRSQQRKNKRLLIWQKISGVFCAFCFIIMVYATNTGAVEFDRGVALGMFVVLGYTIYCLWPGGRTWVLVPWWWF